jgi:hypothetical protein
MRRAGSFSLLVAALLSAGCDTLNVGSSVIDEGRAIVVVTAPASIQPGARGTFTAELIGGGTGPFTIEYQFTGGATDIGHVDPRPLTGEHTDAQAVTFIGSQFGPTSGTVTAVVVHVPTGTTISDTESFIVPVLNPPLLRLSGIFAADTITVVPEGWDGFDDVTINGTAPQGFRLTPLSQVLAAGDPTAEFVIAADDLLNGGSGTVTFTAESSANLWEPLEVAFNIQPLEFAPDTVYAIPLQATAAVGEVVRVVVATGIPANPFRHLAGVRVCAPVESGFNFAPGSLNLGAVGGPMGNYDGFWEAINPTGTPIWRSEFIVSAPTGDGRLGLDLDVSAPGGSDVTSAAGELINFGVTFAAPGTWQLSFQEFETVPRTYYLDSNQAPEYYWSDISNDHPGVPNSVVVE